MRVALFFILACFCLGLKAQQSNIYYPSGHLRYAYTIDQGKLTGQFISYFENGLVLAKGYYVNGRKNGIWQAWDSSGILRTKRYYRDNNDFDLLMEWTSDGSRIDEAFLKNKDRNLYPVDGRNQNIIYAQRNWKKISNGAGNEELFTDAFKDVLEAGITAGRIILFKEDRFITAIDKKDATAIISRKPDEFLTKEQRSFDGNTQHWLPGMIGLGLVYKDSGGDKIAWAYFPDLYIYLKRLKDHAALVAEKLNNAGFSSQLAMSTFQSPEFQPRKIQEEEEIAELFAEIDFETQAWIYLLNKKLLAAR